MLYTDGVTEATDQNQKMFSEEKLVDLFRSVTTESTDTIKNKIIEDLKEYNKKDDVTFIVVKRNP